MSTAKQPLKAVTEGETEESGGRGAVDTRCSFNLHANREQALDP